MKKTVLPLIVVMLFVSTSCAVLGGSAGRRDIAAEYYAVAEGYAGISKYDKAIEYYRKAALRKEFANAANYGLGRMYALSGKWSEACEQFSPLYKAEPSNGLIASAYAFALASNGQKDEALAVYELVYQNSADDPVAARNYAGMLVLTGKYTEALVEIAALKKNFPDSDAVKGIDELEKKAQQGLNPDPLPTVSADSDKKSADQPAAGVAAPPKPVAH